MGLSEKQPPRKKSAKHKLTRNTSEDGLSSSGIRRISSVRYTVSAEGLSGVTRVRALGDIAVPSLVLVIVGGAIGG